MKKFIPVLILYFLTRTAFAQQSLYQSQSADEWIEVKNYKLLSLIEQDKAVSQLLSTDVELSKLTQDRISNINTAVNDCKDTGCYIQSLEMSDAEIKQVSNRLMQLYQPGNALGRLVNQQLIPSAAYSLYKNVSPAELLAKAWEQDAAGINYTIDVYAGGKKPNYPLIDSISFNTKLKRYKNFVYDAEVVLVNDVKKDHLFFQPSLQAALLFLQLNERQDPANYEPMITTVNKAAVDRVPHIQWNKYKYTLLLVPGAGPDNLTTPLSAEGMLRCRLAAQYFQQGQVPFIMVSGGKVHPYKTPYCEAEEMKKYLVHTLHIPENAVIMEPHARHTTTNMRNGVRLIYRYHIPANKPALVITDKSQHDAIMKMDERCERELKYVPYKLGQSLSDTEVEFYPVMDAFQINPYEPLDP
jgi:hypothetical protein